MKDARPLLLVLAAALLFLVWGALHDISRLVVGLPLLGYVGCRFVFALRVD